MDTLAEQISKELRSRSVVLVGPSDSGKSYWIRHTLIPYLESQRRKVGYLPNGDSASTDTSDVVICDEAETLFDLEYLRGDSTESYYSDEYLERVKRWFAHYSLMPRASVFVVTRNHPDQIKNLVDNMHRADWDNRDIIVIEFRMSRNQLEIGSDSEEHEKQ